MASQTQPRIAGSRATILVADDESLVLRTAQRLLEANGYRVLTAVDGIDAVTTYRAHASDIDLVILDVTMPGQAGDRALAEILRFDPDAKVVLTSGYSEGDATRGLVGLAGFLQKPWNHQELLALLDQVLGDRDFPSGSAG